MALLAVVGAAVLPACSRTQQPDCGDGFQPYKGNCLNETAITYLRCTEGRGYSPVIEIGGGVSGTFKVIADASVKAAYKNTKQENTPVALQIVKDCLEIAKTGTGSTSDHTVATTYAGEAQRNITEWDKEQLPRTAHITLSDSSARIGAAITVKGINFLAGETVDIYVAATLVKQVEVDGSGGFSTEVVIPGDAPPSDFNTTVHVTGETSVRSASAPFHT